MLQLYGVRVGDVAQDGVEAVVGNEAIVERGVDDGVSRMESLGDLCGNAVDLDADVGITQSSCVADTHEVAGAATRLENVIGLSAEPFASEPNPRLARTSCMPDAMDDGV